MVVFFDTCSIYEIYHDLDLSYRSDADKTGVLTLVNRGASFSNFRRGYPNRRLLIKTYKADQKHSSDVFQTKSLNQIFNYTRLYSVKSPNVQEAEKLASYKHGRVVKLGATDKITAKLNVHRPGRLATWPCSPCLPLHLCVRFPLRCDVKRTYLSSLGWKRLVSCVR